MKVQAKSQWIITLLTGLLLFSISACTSSPDDLWNSHLQAKKNSDYKLAVHRLQKLLSSTQDNEFKAKAHLAIAEINQFNLDNTDEAQNHYRKALLFANDQSQLIQIQSSLADLLFEKVGDYPQSIVEYSLLLTWLEGRPERETVAIKIAKAHYHQGNLYQALNEATYILEQPGSDETKYEALLLQANIYLAQKEMQKATIALESLLEQYPEKAQSEKIALNLAMSYEELEDFDRAIATLEKLKKDYSTPEYLQIRIDRMKKRKKSRPGASGLKR